MPYAWKGEFKLPWREAGPPNHLDDKVDPDQKVVNEEVSLNGFPSDRWPSISTGSRPHVMDTGFQRN